MYKIPITNYYISDDMPNHNTIKKDVLSMIDEAPNSNLSGTDNFFENEISKLDFNEHGDMSRPWVKRILPEFLDKVGKMVYDIGYMKIHLKALWYQQYKKNDVHDWHVHGENFTGVYYIEYPEGAPATRLYDTKLIVPEIKEGTICVFPANTPHIAPKIDNDLRKTIISFNFNVIEMNANKLEELRSV